MPTPQAPKNPTSPAVDDPAKTGNPNLAPPADPTLETVLPPGDARDLQELRRAAEDGDELAPDARTTAQFEKHQAAIDKLHDRIEQLEAQMLDKQHAAEARADVADEQAVRADALPAAKLDQKYVAKVADAAGLLPAQVFDIKDQGERVRVITVDARKLDVLKKDVK